MTEEERKELIDVMAMEMFLENQKRAGFKLDAANKLWKEDNLVRGSAWRKIASDALKEIEIRFELTEKENYSEQK